MGSAPTEDYRETPGKDYIVAMEKILKILLVFGLLMLLIYRSLHTREKKFRDYYFARRRYAPPFLQTDGTLPSVLLPEPGQPLVSIMDQHQHLSFHVEPGATGTDWIFIVTDESTGNLVASLSLDENVDAMIFDPGTKLIYCCNRTGIMTIILQVKADSYRVMQKLELPPACTRMTLDSARGRLYVYANAEEYMYTNS